MVSGAEPRASQTSRVSSHSSTVSSDGGGPVMLDGTEEGGGGGGVGEQNTICVCGSNYHCVKINYHCSTEHMQLLGVVHTDINENL